MRSAVSVSQRHARDRYELCVRFLCPFFLAEVVGTCRFLACSCRYVHDNKRACDSWITRPLNC
jgi:hypothetical protein